MIPKQTLSEKLEKREKLVENYREVYAEQVEMLEGSLLAKVRPIDSMDILVLGRQLEQYQLFQQMQEEAGNLNQLGILPKIALNVIAATHGMSIMPVIASVQPIDEEQGIVYFENVRSADTKGSQSAGDVVVDPRTGVVTPSGYASNSVSGEEGVTATVAGDFDYTFTLAQYPIRSESLKLSFSGSANIFAEDVGPRGVNKDIGIILGAGLSGTVIYSTGVVSVKFTDDPGAGEKVFADYQVNYELLNDIPRIDTFFDSKAVKAQVYALKSTIGMLQKYTMNKRFAGAGTDTIAKKLVQEINKEIGGDLIRKVKAGALGTTTHSRTLPAGVSEYEHKMSYVDRLNDADAVLLGNAGRGMVKIMIVGRNHAALVKGLPGFQTLHDGNSLGAHVLGKLDDVVYVRVPETSIMGVDEGVGLWKGMTPFEAACVYAPFMPLTVTSIMPESPNPLNDMQAAATMCAVENLVPNYATRFNVVA